MPVLFNIEHFKWGEEPESSQFEVVLIYFIAGLGILLRNAIASSSLLKNLLTTQFVVFIVEFGCLVLPMLLVQTLLSNNVFNLIGTLLATIITMIAVDFILGGLTGAKKTRPFPSDVDTHEAISNSRNWFRAMVFIATSIAILAVDFRVFPNRFAKTESFGHSLMDTGTAAFVFVNALSDFHVLQNGGKIRSPIVSILSIRIPSLFILLLLGIGRSCFILFSGYHQSVTEYGVHWNFFVTLFFLRLFVHAFNYPFSIFVGFLIGVLYEYCLFSYELSGWILRSDGEYQRLGLLDENREGVFSLFGYIMIYSLGLIYACISTVALQRSSKLSFKYILLGGFSQTILFLVAQKFVEAFGGASSSRRLANMAYSLSMVALFSFSVSGLQLLNYFVAAPRMNSTYVSKCLLQAISRNGLIFFLIANLVTGLVNIALTIVWPLLQLNTAQETLFLFIYSFFIALFIFLFNGKKKRK